MENDDHHVISSMWFNVQRVGESHVFPIEDRPGNEHIPTCNNIPIIDLGITTHHHDHESTIQKLIKASQEFGFFQVINHGVPEETTKEAVKVVEEIFMSPVDEITKEAKEEGWVYMGSKSFATKSGAHLWRDNLKHPCHPLEQSMQNWPRRPQRYRDVMRTYIAEITRLSLRIMEMISRGLGLEKGYLGRISRVQFLTASKYLACPDPSLTLGLLKHFDHSLITILHQSGHGEGLQVVKDGKWIGVEVVPNAFVVNIGTQLEIISNGKLKSAEHRVVTNKEVARTSVTTFVNPCGDCIIEPARVLLDEHNPPLYPSSSFEQFVNVSKPFGPYTHVVQNNVNA